MIKDWLQLALALAIAFILMCLVDWFMVWKGWLML